MFPNAKQNKRGRIFDNLNSKMCSAVHRDAFCQFLFQWIYYCYNSKSTGKETGKTHLCAVCRLTFRCRLDYQVQYVVPGAVYIIYGADLDRGL